jgi:large subunit ribosomal protein L4
MATTKKTQIEKLVSKVIRVTEANKRRATAKTKKRGEVSGGGKKPWRQKGTGRARAGSSRSPLWRGGGITFGPTGNQNPSLSLNKKESQAAKKAALEAKKTNTVSVTVSAITKTKEAAELLKKNNISGRTLVLFSEKTKSGEKESDKTKNLRKVFANLKDVYFAKESDTSAADILWAKNIVILSEKVAAKNPSTKLRAGETK